MERKHVNNYPLLVCACVVSVLRPSVLSSYLLGREEEGDDWRASTPWSCTVDVGCSQEDIAVGARWKGATWHKHYFFAVLYTFFQKTGLIGNNYRQQMTKHNFVFRLSLFAKLPQPLPKANHWRCAGSCCWGCQPSFTRWSKITNAV